MEATQQPPTQGDNLQSDRYIIIPTTQITILNMIYVVIVFIIYLFVIAYISLYNSRNIPNLRMFIDFITDNNEPTNNLSKEIDNIIKNLPDNLKKTNENFSTINDKTPMKYIIGWWNYLKENVETIINKLIVKTFVKGNKIKTSYKINM
jgi:hypothetical protein